VLVKMVPSLVQVMVKVSGTISITSGFSSMELLPLLLLKTMVKYGL